LIDPVIQTTNPSKVYAPASTYRRDLWPSREDAVGQFASNKFYQAWDPRVFDKWTVHGLRELPTEIYPYAGAGVKAVTLTTPKSQEVFSFLRPKYKGDPNVPPTEDRTTYGDMYPDDIEDYPFYRPEPAQLFRQLPQLKPSTLYVFGEHSDLSPPEARRQKMEVTGTGVGGNGGQALGRVKQTVLDCGHLVPMEKVMECANAAASFVGAELDRWESEMQAFRERWCSKPRIQRVSIDDTWKQKIGPRPVRKAAVAEIGRQDSETKP